MIASVQTLVLVVVWTLMPHAAVGQPSPKEVAFGRIHMALDLRVDYERGAIVGTETMRVKNVSTHAVTQVPLLLNRLMTISRATDAAGSTLPVSQDVVVFADDSMRQVTAAIVRLGRSVPAGDSVTIVLHYAGRLVGYTETGSLYIRDHVDHDFTILREDAYAFPALGVPSSAVNRTMRRDDFSFTARLTVPGDLVVAMGGRQLPPVKQDRLVRWSYQSDAPVPFLNITIAPYKVLDGPGARIFYFPQDSAGAPVLERDYWRGWAVHRVVRDTRPGAAPDGHGDSRGLGLAGQPNRRDHRNRRRIP
jgi:hypothetical protein